jgi:predicted ester cyclase
MPNHSKDLLQRWCEDMFNKRNLAVCDELFAERYVEHASAPFEQTEPGEVNGPAHMRGVVEWLYDQFPDLHMEIECLIAESDIVAARVLSTGTNLGKLGGVAPPTGKSFAARQSHWFRVDGQKLAEHWVTRDDLITMLQLGVVQPQGQRPR